MHRIEVRLKSHLPDARGLGLVKDIQDLGITGSFALQVKFKHSPGTWGVRNTNQISHSQNSLEA